MKKDILIFVSFVMLLFFFGCMKETRVADFTLLASKNISTLEGAQKMGTFEGEHCMPAITGQMPNQKEALDKALEKGAGNAMVDAVIYYKPANCIFADHCWTVKGTVIKTKDMLIKSQINKDFNIMDANYIRETITSQTGHKYFAYKKKSAIELDNDTKRYDLIIRVE